MSFDRHSGGGDITPADEVLGRHPEEVGGVRGEFGQVVEFVLNILRHCTPLVSTCVEEETGG